MNVQYVFKILVNLMKTRRMICLISKMTRPTEKEAEMAFTFKVMSMITCIITHLLLNTSCRWRRRTMMEPFLCYKAHKEVSCNFVKTCVLIIVQLQKTYIYTHLKEGHSNLQREEKMLTLENKKNEATLEFSVKGCAEGLSPPKICGRVAMKAFAKSKLLIPFFKIKCLPIRKHLKYNTIDYKSK